MFFIGKVYDNWVSIENLAYLVSSDKTRLVVAPSFSLFHVIFSVHC
jgi:hypothetical protein